jgi:hypothetical protein
MTQSKETKIGTAGGVSIVALVTVVAFSTYGWLKTSEHSEILKAHAATPADDDSVRSIAYDAPAEAVEESPTSGAAETVEAGASEKSSETTVPFQTVAKGTKSGIKTGERMCVTEEEEWLGLWRRHLTGSLQTEPCPSVDFEHNMLLAVFQGEGDADSGFVEIEKVKQLPDKILVVLKRNDAKAPTSEGERATTTSFHIAKTAKINLPVVFQ